MQEFLQQISRDAVGNSGNLNFTVTLFALILGCILSWIVIYIHRKVVGSFVSELMNVGATSEENSKTLQEIGMENNGTVINLLKKENGLSKVVTVIGASEYEKGRREIPDDARFYIGEEAMIRAREQYSTKGTNVLVLLLGIVGIIVVGLVLYLLLGTAGGLFA